MAHKGLPVAGYSEQSDANVELVNLNKRSEERLLRRIDKMAANPEIDQRWLAIARTSLEQAFMALNRSVFAPSRIELPEDSDDGA